MHIIWKVIFKEFTLGRAIIKFFAIFSICFIPIYIIVSFAYVVFDISIEVLYRRNPILFLVICISLILAFAYFLFKKADECAKEISSKLDDDEELKVRLLKLEFFMISTAIGFVITNTLQVIYISFMSELDVYFILLYIATFIVFGNTIVDLYKEYKLKSPWIPNIFVALCAAVPFFLTTFQVFKPDTLNNYFNYGSGVFTFLSFMCICLIRLRQSNVS